jgi:predicted RNA-binding protein with PIN domain
LVNIGKVPFRGGFLGLRIVVDGYNFIGANEGLSLNLQAQRNHLIDRLSVYQTIKQIPVCVVFDAWKEGTLSQHFEMQKGVEVIFSRLGEKADQVIIRLIERLKEQCIVVSSDREIRNVADQEGATSLTIGEFQRKLDQADETLSSGEMGKLEEEYPSRDKKGGNPNRLSKKERAKKAKLKKL